MNDQKLGPSFYRARAQDMREMAEKAHSESIRATYLRLEISWLRLAEAAEKGRDPNSED
jgi:hypothetical protein